MTSRNDLMSVSEIRKVFNQSLRDAIELGLPPISTYAFEPNVIDALNKIADSYPDVDPAEIKSARSEFRRYLAWLTSPPRRE